MIHVRSVLIATLHVLLLSVSVSGGSVDLKRAAVREYVARNTKVPVILEKGSIVPCRMADEQGGICALSDPTTSYGITTCPTRMCFQGYICGQEAAQKADKAMCEVREVFGGYSCKDPLNAVPEQDCPCKENTEPVLACQYYGPPDKEIPVGYKTDSDTVLPTLD